MESAVAELLQQVDKKLNSIYDDIRPIANAAQRSIDERLFRGLDPLLRCFDMIQAFRAESSGDLDYRLAIIAAELESVLESIDVERYTVDLYDAEQQRIVESRATKDPEKHGTLAASLNVGFRRGEHILRRQHVAIYKYDEGTI